MITSTTAKMTYTVADGITEYAIGFAYQTNPDSTPQIKVYVNNSVNDPLVYGTNYTLSLDGTKIELVSGAEAGDKLTIIRNIPVVQLSDYVVGRIDPEQIEKDFDLAVERDQQQSARITVTEEQLAAHDERISGIEELIPEDAAEDNMLATESDLPTKVSDLDNDAGYITGITSSDVTTALGYTPYDSSNPAGYTTNTGTVTSVNNVLPVDGNVTLELPTAVQSDWNQADNTKVDYIKNKPTIPTVNNATITFSQGGVTKGTITLNQSSNETITLDAGGGGGTNLPDQTGHSGEFLTTNGTTASWSVVYGTLPSQIGQGGKFLTTDGGIASWTSIAYSDVSGTPSLATVATSGAYSDLSGTPSLAAVATSGAYSDLTGTPSLATVATSGAYGDLSGTPSIPTVNDATITFTQGGVTKGTITTNQSSAATIALDAGGGSPKTVNAAVIGSLTINGTDVSGFSSANYLETYGNFGLATASSFEIVVVFTTPNSLSDDIDIMRGYYNSNKFLRIDVTDSKKIHVVVANSGVTQQLTGDTVLSENTKYYAKFVYDGTNYTISLSTDGANYTQEATHAASNTPASEVTTYVLNKEQSGTIVASVLHMDEWYVKVNNSVIWRGAVGHDLIAFQIPTSSNNYTWYRKYRDGWVEQGGNITSLTGSSNTWITVAVSLPVEMSDGNYTVTTSGTGADAGSSGFLVKDDKTSVGFNFMYFNASSDAVVGWEVKGIAQG